MSLPDHQASEIHDGLVLALLARKRLLVLVGEAGSGHAAVYRQLVEHIASDGAMVLPVTANPGIEIEDLILEAAAGVRIGEEDAEADFDALIGALEERLDLAGTGLLAVENAGALAPPVLADLVELTRSETAAGRFLQVLLCGTPDLERSLARAGLSDALRELGVIYRMAPGAAPPPTRRWRWRWKPRQPSSRRPRHPNPTRSPSRPPSSPLPPPGRPRAGPAGTAAPHPPAGQRLDRRRRMAGPGQRHRPGQRDRPGRPDRRHGDARSARRLRDAGTRSHPAAPAAPRRALCRGRLDDAGAARRRRGRRGDERSGRAAAQRPDDGHGDGHGDGGARLERYALLRGAQPARPAGR
ncbi:AAA family ATPase [Azospirillum doebereinerae]|uniref:AAA family ATPase n=1 Tax=Azospirillum doebereinerae TaxID=92933 RepID=UPI003850041A